MSEHSGTKLKILEEIRESFMKYQGNDLLKDPDELFVCSPSKAPADTHSFYLKELEDNLMYPMAPQHLAEYGDGAGSEMEDKQDSNGVMRLAKMKAVHSSSAMAFNLLGNTICQIRNKKVGWASDSTAPLELPECAYDIQYEYKIRTLDTSVNGIPAHLDAWLTGVDDKTVIACEMKMTEWTTRPAKVDWGDGNGSIHGLKEAYTLPESYRCYHEGDKQTADAFVSLAKRIDEYVKTDHPRYDVAQMFKHCMALYNATLDANIHFPSGQRKIILLNCVWEPSEKLQAELARHTRADWVGQERDGFHWFMNNIVEPSAGEGIKAAFDSRGFDFSLVYCTARQLACALEREISYPTIRRYY